MLFSVVWIEDYDIDGLNTITFEPRLEGPRGPRAKPPRVCVAGGAVQGEMERNTCLSLTDGEGSRAPDEDRKPFGAVHP